MYEDRGFEGTDLVQRAHLDTEFNISSGFLNYFNINKQFILKPLGLIALFPHSNLPAICKQREPLQTSKFQACFDNGVREQRCKQRSWLRTTLERAEERRRV